MINCDYSSIAPNFQRLILWSRGVNEIPVVLFKLSKVLSLVLDNGDEMDDLQFEEFSVLVSRTPSTHSVYSHIPTPSHEILVLLSSGLIAFWFTERIVTVTT